MHIFKLKNGQQNIKYTTKIHNTFAKSKIKFNVYVTRDTHICVWMQKLCTIYNAKTKRNSAFDARNQNKTDNNFSIQTTK